MEERATDKPGYKDLLEALRMLATGSYAGGDRRAGEGRPAGTRSFRDEPPADPIAAIDKAALVELVPASTAFVLANLITDAIHDFEAAETNEGHQPL